MEIPIETVKSLREKTGISVMQCKKVLMDANGDMEKALILLRKKGSDIASRKSDRDLGAGVVASYIHSNGKIGVLLELLCETDFVAKNKEFKDFADDIAMHIAAMSPAFLNKDEIVDNDRKKAEETFMEETAKLDKPNDVKEKITQGKVETYFKEKILLSQQFVKDPSCTIQECIEQMTQKMGERIEVARFARYSLLE